MNRQTLLGDLIKHNRADLISLTISYLELSNNYNRPQGPISKTELKLAARLS